jgi:hypothetical protein
MVLWFAATFGTIKSEYGACARILWFEFLRHCYALSSSLVVHGPSSAAFLTGSTCRAEPSPDNLKTFFLEQAGELLVIVLSLREKHDPVYEENRIRKPYR